MLRLTDIFSVYSSFKYNTKNAETGRYSHYFGLERTSIYW